MANPPTIFACVRVALTAALLITSTACAGPVVTPAGIQPEAPAAITVPAPDPTAAPTPASTPATPPAVTAAPVEKAPPAQDPAIAANAYTIAIGDTISGVAGRYGVDLGAMLAANGLTIYSPIMPGQVVKLTGPPIPVKAPVAPPAAPAATKVVNEPAPTAPSAGHVITIAGSGGQGMVDRCIGPIHFTPVTQSYSITEHDFCGGWARFSGIQVGETVTVTGVGTYTVTGRGNVPNPGTTDKVVAALGRMPPVFLQTCIPGTSMMLVIGLG